MNITVQKRGHQTKGERKQRMKQGFIPGAIYGKGLEPVNIEVSSRAIAEVLNTATALNTVLDLIIEGDTKPHTVLVDNLQRNAITRGFESVGFHQVRKGDKVTAQIPIQLVGEPETVGTGEAVLEQTSETITVHALPGDLPAHLDVDVSGMAPGDILHVADLPHNAKLEYTAGEEITIAALHYSRTAAAVEEADIAVAEADLSGQDAVTELRSEGDPSTDTITEA